MSDSLSAALIVLINFQEVKCSVSQCVEHWHTAQHFS
jgi:hypothetical protein